MSEITDQSGPQLAAANPPLSDHMDDSSIEHSIDHREGPAVEQASQSDEAMQMLREVVETVVLALVMFLIIRQGVQNYRIESHSMQPNFYEGQFVLVNKLAYRLGEPQRGDVVVFHNPDNAKEDYIKRVDRLARRYSGFY